MYSLKYLDAPDAKIRRAINSQNPYALSYHCPSCDRRTTDQCMRLLEETGGMAKYLVYLCGKCRIVFKYLD